MHTIAGTLLSDCFPSFWDDSIHATFLVTRNCLVEFFKLALTYFSVCGRTWLAYVWYVAETIVETRNQLKIDCGRWQELCLKVRIFQSFNIILFFFLNFIRVNYLLFDLFYDILLIKIKIIVREKYNIRTCHSFLKNMEIFIAICFSHFTVSKTNLKTYWTIRKYRLNCY